MNERGSSKQDIVISADRTTQVKEFEYLPFSILHNPALQQAHELYLTYCSQKNGLSGARWLVSLTVPQEDGKLPFNNRFYSFSDNSPLSTPEPKQLVATTGLLTYTSAKLEQLLRLQGVSTPEGTDNGISVMLSSELAQLSNAYRSQYRLDQGKAYLLDIAHSLAMYALRFKRPDHHGYSQPLGHWLHLPVSVDSMHLEMLDQYEEVLKLSLALEEIGYGPQQTYVKFLVGDLKTLYELRGDSESVQELEEHFKDIPSIQDEIEKAWQKEYDLRRKKEMEARSNQVPKRRKRRRR